MLSRTQLYDLGKSIEKIQSFFFPAYRPPAYNPTAWYALEVDLKFNLVPGEN